MHDGSRGLFVTLEGPEGCGKSTQVRLLADRLRAAGRGCVVTREPGGTALGEAVRGILLDRDLAPVPAADALLFNAARAQLVAEVIGPALRRGDIVLSDRFADSTVAYQGFGAGRPIEELRALQAIAIGNLRPDLTVLIDIPAEAGLARKQADEITRFEERHDLEFHRRVRQGFLALAAEEPDRWLVVDGGALDVESVAGIVFEAVLQRLGAAESAPAGDAGRGYSGESTPSSEPERDFGRMNR